jgi:hypothetical protein
MLSNSQCSLPTWVMGQVELISSLIHCSTNLWMPVVFQALLSAVVDKKPMVPDKPPYVACI